MRTPHNDPELSAALDAEKTAASQKLAVLASFKVQSPAHRAAFAAALTDVQTAWKRLDAREKAITRPALEGVESARELFRGPKAGYKALEQCIKSALADYETRCALEVQEATDRAYALTEAGDVDGARDALVRAGEVPARGDGVRHPWGWEVINIHLMPDHFLLPNARELSAEMRRQLDANPNETPVVPGVKFARTIQIVAPRAPTRPAEPDGSR